jgi:hypothetical protein
MGNGTELLSARTEWLESFNTGYAQFRHKRLRARKAIFGHECPFALTFIRAGRLAQITVSPCDIKNVVNNLEEQAQLLGVGTYGVGLRAMFSF